MAKMTVSKTLFCLSALIVCSSAGIFEDLFKPSADVYPEAQPHYPDGWIVPGQPPVGSGIPPGFEDKRVFIVTLNKNVRDPWTTISNMFPPQGPYQQHGPVDYPQYGGF